MGGLNRIAVFFGVVATVAWTMVALSVAGTIRPADMAETQIVADAAPPAATDRAAEPLSHRLSRSDGVIRPGAEVDPGLAQTPPGTNGKPGATPK